MDSRVFHILSHAWHGETRPTPNSRGTGSGRLRRKARRVLLWLAKALGLVSLAVTLGILAARFAFMLPDRNGVAETRVLAAPENGRLASAIRSLTTTHPHESGIALMSEGSEAFAVRALLANTADRSIDAQYYIWHDDLTGMLLLETLRDAADRSVRVRLLLDDNGVRGLDSILTNLDEHPNIEIRLFNPFVLRRPKFLNFAFDFFRLNRRMHNKSFTVDNAITIVGGRNVGDEYFGTGSNPLFVDMDVLAIGKIVPAVSSDFDRYWNSDAAYPVSAIIRNNGSRDSSFDTALDKFSTHPRSEVYRRSLVESETVKQLVAKDLTLEWVPVQLVSDDPEKVLRRAADDQLLFSQLTNRLGEPRSRLDLVSPYFVPGARGTAELVEMAQRGVNVRIFTNSYLATDVVAVHAGYTKYREQLLQSGIELLEMKPVVTPGDRRSDMGLAGSSSASLHAKIFSVDGTKLYVGSFNFDPRSMFLNTEMGFVIDSDVLAHRIHDGLSERAESSAYRPVLNDDAVIWYECRQGVQITHRHEPGSGVFGRLAIRSVGWLPVQWLL